MPPIITAFRKPRSRFQRLFRLISLSLIVVLFIGGAARQPAHAQDTPTAEYQAIIDASKAEKGLLVYSTLQDESWATLFDEFKAKYPWINIEHEELESREVITRYLDEVDSGTRTADLIGTSAEGVWESFLDQNELVDYKSIEDAHLPDWAKDAGIYSMSVDPIGIAWNTSLVPNPPKSLAELAAMIIKNPADFKGKLSTADARRSLSALETAWYWTHQLGEPGWKIFDTLGSTRIAAKINDAEVVDSVESGETKIGFFVSFAAVEYQRTDPNHHLGWSLLSDGTPLITHDMAITKHGLSPNSAKLLLDFILSAEGQIALSEGGQTVYRDDVDGKAKFHLTDLEAGIGQGALIYVDPTPELNDDDKMIAFLTRWKEVFGLP